MLVTILMLVGPGGPYITISNFHTNGSDPEGELWKCSESGYGNKVIISYDGVRFCFPRRVLAFDIIFSESFESSRAFVGIDDTFYAGRGSDFIEDPGFGIAPIDEN